MLNVDESLIALIVFIWIIVTAWLYDYGKSRGGKEILKQAGLISPSLSEITIRGKYRIPKMQYNEVKRLLNEYFFKSFGGIYGVSSNPRNVEIRYIVGGSIKDNDYFKHLGNLRHGLPYRMVLKIVDSDDSGHIVEAICLPIMVQKMGQQVQYLYPKPSVEDAQLQCKMFMDNIMGVLQAETLMPPYVESSKMIMRKSEFVYNTPSENLINEKACKMMKEARHSIYVTGWIDREVLGYFENAISRNIEVKVVTRDTRGSDELIREDFKSLIKKIGSQNVKLNRRCHDRFLICDECGLIGSPYYTVSSRTRFESAIFTDDPDIVRDLKTHFRRIWDDSDSIHPTR